MDIFQLTVLELRGASDSSTSSNKMVCFYHTKLCKDVEYWNYNSNSGFFNERLRNTQQPSCHFPFERSGRRLPIVDIQGVGYLYTDLQIHTADGVGYSNGILVSRGMDFSFTVIALIHCVSG
ncbi:Eukaryotic elongation factor 2 kinase [Fasciolopsis buskii]|uniref:Eukaryotic elongation factor 2 kinase n=1 Tax=Fasciolopsis buskii TaxID=27845 RepID=A0A8E0S7F9_9TREM|nr:Eukaryotic elongation factor 2 kinase [Fasciolopsis buski]